MSKHTQQWLKYAEQNRREKNGQFSTAPLYNGDKLVDYGEPLSALISAIAHLSEGLPGGQMERSLAALAAAKAAVMELEVWARLNNIGGGAGWVRENSKPR